jgi:hypothetical protein
VTEADALRDELRRARMSCWLWRAAALGLAILLGLSLLYGGMLNVAAERRSLMAMEEAMAERDRAVLAEQAARQAVQAAHDRDGHAP